MTPLLSQDQQSKIRDKRFMKTGKEIETSSILNIAGLIMCAARTSPKTRGIDNIQTLLIDDGETKKKIVEKMKQISRDENRPFFERDANSIQFSPAIILIGVRKNPAGLNCGFCGYLTCEELKETKGICSYNSIDLGIAICSSVIMANQLNIDNRIMCSVGRAALGLGLFERDVTQALGIPLSITGKNPFFDRK
jgi:uncharacterized ferredoxin-like protein